MKINAEASFFVSRLLELTRVITVNRTFGSEEARVELYDEFNSIAEKLARLHGIEINTRYRS